MASVMNIQMRARPSTLQHARLTAPSDRRHGYTDTPAADKGNRPQRGSLQAEIDSRNNNNAAQIDTFWRRPAVPRSSSSADADRTGIKHIKKVSTDLRISLKSPPPEMDENSEEFKRQAKELKRDMKRLSRCTSMSARGAPGRRKSKSPARLDEELRETTEQLEQHAEIRRRLSIQDGKDFLQDFLQSHFSDHVDQIRITSTHTLEEIKMIGNEPKETGVRQCKGLIRVPVIDEDIALLMWEELRQGDALDHSHEYAVYEEDDDKENISPEEMKRRRSEALAEYLAMQESPCCTSNGCMVHGGMSNSRRESDRKDILSSSRGTFDQATSEKSPTAAPVVLDEQAAATVASVAISQTQIAAKSCLPIAEKRKFDGFLNEVKSRTVKGAEYIAASLATGYA